jgi:UDP-2,4-diacetamido-2,4,6-trideoxy-beta-L-altropyranose hydrolase/UDP-4-amino-4,6-dideoxy-N-acetyl-beta-L-altrosamine N-acetyltransferase
VHEPQVGRLRIRLPGDAESSQEDIVWVPDEQIWVYDVHHAAECGPLAPIEMKVAFRADASTTIGRGHVMRCLALADALRRQDWDCHFICREYPGHAIDIIREEGLRVSALPMAKDFRPSRPGWLGSDWQSDAEETLRILKGNPPDWLVVDHYALDARWEERVKPAYSRLLVVDDLADRPHGAEVLVDPNLGRHRADYAGLVPHGCTILCGPEYALLRSEFLTHRTASLERRREPQVLRVLVSMGGTDVGNVTGRVLAALELVSLPDDCHVTVVMGAGAPSLTDVQKQAADMKLPTDVLVDVRDMASVMAVSDLAIGGAGATAWERCCLGLPALVVVLAQNQRAGATALDAAGAACLVGDVNSLDSSIPAAIKYLSGQEELRHMSLRARRLCDGRGVDRVIRKMSSDNTAKQMDGVVRPMVSGDLEMVRRWRNHPDIRVNMYTKHEVGQLEHRAWFERSSQEQARHLLIVEGDGDPLGFVSFTEVGSPGVAEWGFYAIPDAPRGTGRKLGHLALDYAFDVLNVEEVRGEVLASNERSIAFHIALGFKEELTRSEQNIEGDGPTVVIHFTLMAEEWDPRRKIQVRAK